MKLRISFPDNLVMNMLIKQTHIPCLIIGSNELIISFTEPLHKVSGIVEDWDVDLFEARATPGVGGEYSYYHHGMITIREEGQNIYKIVDLMIFYSDLGWCDIIKNEEYVEPYKWLDSDLESAFFSNE